MLYDLGLIFNLIHLSTYLCSFDARFYLATNTTPERLSENDTIYHQQILKIIMHMTMVLLRQLMD